MPPPGASNNLTTRQAREISANYRSHRLQVLSLKPVVDACMEPQYLPQHDISNRRKNSEVFLKEMQIDKQNQSLYERLRASSFTDDMKNIQKKATSREAFRSTLVRSKCNRRQTRLKSIAKQNEKMNAKLSNAKTKYDRTRMEAWFKSLVRKPTRNFGIITAGIPQELLPKRLPKLEAGFGGIGSTGDLSYSSHIDSKIALASASILSSPSVFSLDTRSLIDKSYHTDLGIECRPSMPLLKSIGRSRSFRRLTSRPDLEPDANIGGKPDVKPAKMSLLRVVTNVCNISRDPIREPFTIANEHTLVSYPLVRQDSVVLAARTYAIPFDSRNCTVEISADKESYSETIKVQLLTYAGSPVVLQTLVYSIDEVHDILDSYNRHVLLVGELPKSDGKNSIRSLLMNALREYDFEGSGMIHYERFVQVMMTCQIGISLQQIRCLLTQVEMTNDGMVNYDLFLLSGGVDQIQEFRARIRTFQHQMNHITEQELLSLARKNVSFEDVTSIAKKCLLSIEAYDSERSGVVPLSILMSKLHSFAAVGLTSYESLMISQTLPRDSGGRCVYTSFAEVLYDIRIHSLANSIMESNSLSELERYLLNMCRELERQCLNEEVAGDGLVQQGTIPVSGLINALLTSTRLSLPKFFIVYIMADAVIKDDFLLYAPLVTDMAKKIYTLLSYWNLLEATVVWEQLNVTDDELLRGLSPEFYRHKLTLQFQRHDVDRSGAIDEFEFKECLAELDFQFTSSEMTLLWAILDVHGADDGSFDDFADFITKYVLNIQRYSRLYGLLSYHNKSKAPIKHHYLTLLRATIKREDVYMTGQVMYCRLIAVLKKQLSLPAVCFDIIISCIQFNTDYMVKYDEFIVRAAELLLLLHDGDGATDSQSSTALYEQARSIVDKYHKESVKCTAKMLLLCIPSPLTDVRALAKQIFRTPFFDLTPHEYNYICYKVIDMSENIVIGLSLVEELVMHVRTLTTMIYLLRNDMKFDDIAEGIDVTLCKEAAASGKQTESSATISLSTCFDILDGCVGVVSVGGQTRVSCDHLSEYFTYCVQKTVCGSGLLVALAVHASSAYPSLDETEASDSVAALHAGLASIDTSNPSLLAALITPLMDLAHDEASVLATRLTAYLSTYKKITPSVAYLTHAWLRLNTYLIRRDRFVLRRTALIKHPQAEASPSHARSADSEAWLYSPLKKIGDSLLNALQLTYDADELVISFNSSDSSKAADSSIQRTMSKLVENVAALHERTVRVMGHADMEEARVTVKVCLLYARSSLDQDTSKSLDAVEFRILSADSPLLARVKPLLLTLPSVGVVDSDAANSFVANLVEHLAITFIPPNKSEEDREADDSANTGGAIGGGSGGGSDSDSLRTAGTSETVAFPRLIAVFT